MNVESIDNDVEIADEVTVESSIPQFPNKIFQSEENVFEENEPEDNFLDRSDDLNSSVLPQVR